MSNMNRSNSSPKKQIRDVKHDNKLLNSRTSATLGQQLQLLQTHNNNMHNSISASSNLSSNASSNVNSINLPLNAENINTENKYKKAFKYRQRNCRSLSQVEMKSISTRVANKEININNYHSKSLDSHGNKLVNLSLTSPIKKVKRTSYGTKLVAVNKPIGGGYATDISDVIDNDNINTAISTHLRSY